MDAIPVTKPLPITVPRRVGWIFQPVGTPVTRISFAPGRLSGRMVLTIIYIGMHLVPLPERFSTTLTGTGRTKTLTLYPWVRLETFSAMAADKFPLHEYLLILIPEIKSNNGM